MGRRRISAGAPQSPAYVNGYVDGESVVLVSRDDAGARKFKRVQADWACYVLLEELGDMRRTIESSKYVVGTRPEGKWLRISWRDRFARDRICRDHESPFTARAIRTFEGDLSPLRRHCADNGVRIAAPRRVYLDIETDSRVPFSRAREGDTRMFAWALVAEDGEIIRATKTYSRLARRAEAEDNAAPGRVGAIVNDHGCAMLARDSSDDAERELLEAMWNALDPFDQVIAWGSQSGDTFDFAVIFRRSEELGLRVDARAFVWLDYCCLFARMNKNGAESGEEKVSLKLNAVARTFGVGEKHDFDASKTYESFTADQDERMRLLKYNLQDTELMPLIEGESGYISLHQTVSDACGVFPDTNAANPTTFVDQFIIRLGLERGEHFPTKVHREGNEDQFKGAYVMEPLFKGITRDVHVCDFASLYPSIIITWNMSPETKRGRVDADKPIPADCSRAPGTEVCFDTTQKGIFPVALEEMGRLRKYWSDLAATLPPGSPAWFDAMRRSTAYKVASNSFYGFLGSPWSRVFDREVAESVTQAGAWLILETKAASETKTWSFFFGYGDTDSGFAAGQTKERFDEFVKWCNAELYPKKLRELGCRDNRIKLAYEKQFGVLVMVTAKRYVGRFVHYKGAPATNMSKPEIKGLEYKRGDSARLARLLQERVIKLLVGEWRCELCEGTNKKECEGHHAPRTEEVKVYEGLIEEMRRHVLEDDLERVDVVISQQLTKPIKAYKAKPKKGGGEGTLPAHVQVAKVLFERGAEVDEGTRIEYVVVDGEQSPMKVIPAEDFKGHFDRFHLWENKVWPPTEKLLAAAFPKHNWAMWSKARPPKRSRVSEDQMGFGFGSLSASARTLTKERVVDESFAALAAAADTASSERSEELPRRRKVSSGGAVALKKPEPDPQIAKPASAAVPAMRRRADTDYVIRVHARDRKKLAALKDVLTRPEHAGPRMVVLRFILPTGAEVELGAAHVRVKASDELTTAIERVLA